MNQEELTRRGENAIKDPEFITLLELKEQCKNRHEPDGLLSRFTPGFIRCYSRCDNIIESSYIVIQSHIIAPEMFDVSYLSLFPYHDGYIGRGIQVGGVVNGKARIYDKYDIFYERMSDSDEVVLIQ